MIASPMTPTMSWPPGTSISLAVIVSCRSCSGRAGADGDLDAADADDAVEDRLAGGDGRLASALAALLVAVPERRPRAACQSTSRNIPMRDHPDQHPAERLLRELAQRAAARRRALAVAEGELEREPADQQVDDAVRDQPGAARPSRSSRSSRAALGVPWRGRRRSREVGERGLDGPVEGGVGVDHRPAGCRPGPPRGPRRPGSRGSRRPPAPSRSLRRGPRGRRPRRP